MQPIDKIGVLRNGILEKFGDRDEVLADLAASRQPAQEPQKSKPMFAMQASASIVQPKQSAE